MNNIIKTLFILTLSMSFPTFGEELNNSNVHNKEFAEQELKPVINTLTLSVRTSWEDNIKTVGSAVRYILEPSGYSLVIDYPAPKEALDISLKAIPPVAKINRTMPIIDLIQILIGMDNTIVIDHEHKLLSFQKGVAKWRKTYSALFL